MHRVAPRRTEKLSAAEQPTHPLELDTIASHWQQALDAAQRALAAAAGSLPASDVGRRQRELASERREVADMLARLARSAGVRPVPWLSPVPVTTKSLGLPAGVRACLFDLDGVLTDSGVLHAWAWGEVFDEFLLRLSEKTGWHFIPFDRGSDYRAYVDGRRRLDGVHAFLGSRGIRLREGRAEEPAGADTAHGLAKRKGEVIARGLRQRGVSAVAGARRYLEAAGHAGLKRAVVSASANTLPMLERAGLMSLVEMRIDAEVISAGELRSRPAPDLLLVACRRLGVRPDEAVTFTHSAAGVAAGHAAGLAVIGVGDEAQLELLRGFGAERTVPSLRALLDPQLLAQP
jgi:beta-phosphoglucomutase-like phosphatase (HAD superfamily)